MTTVKINEWFLKQYSTFLLIEVILTIGHLLSELTNKIKVFVIPKCFLFYRNFIICNIHGEYLTLFSIIISFLAILMAAWTIVLSSIKVCGISNSTIIKTVFYNQFFLCRVAIFSSPILLGVLAIFSLTYTFFAVFASTVINHLYMLHLCLSINLDLQIKYTLIPQYMCEQYLREKYEKIVVQDVSVYREFINSFSMEQLREYQNMVNLFVDKLIHAEQLDRFKVYQEVYSVFGDIKGSLLRNIGLNMDFLHIYFGIGAEMFGYIQKKDVEKDLLISIYLAIFKNLVECTEIEVENYNYELNDFINRTVNQIKSERLSEYLISSLLLMEIALKQQNEVVVCFCDAVYSIINKLIDEIVVSYVSKEKFNESADNIKLLMFVDFLDGGIYKNRYDDYIAIYEGLFKDIENVIHKYGNEHKSANTTYSSRVFLLFRMKDCAKNY